MKVRNIFLVLIAIAPFFGLAQSVTHLHSSFYEFVPDRVVVAVSPDGNVFRGESVNLLPQFGVDIFRLFAFDENTVLLDSIDFGGFVERAAMEADNNNVYLNLQFYDVDSYPVILPGIGEIETGDYNNGCLVVALTHDLQIEWYDFYSSNSLTGFWDCDIFINGSGNILFNVGGNLPGYFLYTLVKEYTPEGVIVNELFQDQLIYSIDEDSQGNIYFIGPCANLDANFNGTAVTLTTDYNFYIVKYNSEFQYVWSNYVEEITCSFTDLVVNSGDDVYLSVALMTGTYFFDDIQTDITSGLHYVLAKINSESGSFEWVQAITSTGNEAGITVNNNNAFLTSDNQGNFYLTSNASGELHWNNGQVTSDVNQAPFVAKILTTGLVDWVILASEYNFHSSVQSIEFSETGCLIFSGTGKGILAFDTVQIDHPGYFSFCGWLQLDTGTTGWEDINAGNLRIFPNPANDHIYITHGGVEDTFVSIQISTPSGKNIRQSKVLNSGTIQFDVKSLPKGFYILKLTGEKGIYSGKFTKM